MKPALCLLLIATLLFTGCRTTSSTQTSIFRKPCWWERRMDRLDTWDRHHNYVVTKSVENTKTVVLYTLVATGTVALILAGWYFDDQFKQNHGARLEFPPSIP